MQHHDDLRPETVAVTAGRLPREPGAPLSTPIVAASTYHHGAEPAYARSGTPTWAALEEAIGALEGGTATAFSSGMAAASAILDLVPPGARVVAPGAAYFGVTELLRERAERGAIVLVPVDPTDLGAVVAALPGAALLWLETPTNPLLEVVDVEAAADAARAAGARTVVDATFASPLGLRPLALGADVSLQSATKLIGGHSDLLLGLATAADPALAARLHGRREAVGATPGALEAFLALRGLRTLPVRLERAQATAAELARRLDAHPAVERVRYPGLPSHPGHALAARMLAGPGALLSFDVRGGADAADRVCAALRLVVHATSLGGVETLAERRARYASERANGTPAGLVRMSVGLEHVDDLWADLARALGG